LGFDKIRRMFGGNVDWQHFSASLVIEFYRIDRKNTWIAMRMFTDTEVGFFLLSRLSQSEKIEG
jgi:hypothetical protein